MMDSNLSLDSISTACHVLIWKIGEGECSVPVMASMFVPFFFFALMQGSFPPSYRQMPLLDGKIGF